jgi:hypothetical protein
MVAAAIDSFSQKHINALHLDIDRAVGHETCGAQALGLLWPGVRLSGEEMTGPEPFFRGSEGCVAVRSLHSVVSVLCRGPRIQDGGTLIRPSQPTRHRWPRRNHRCRSYARRRFAPRPGKTMRRTPRATAAWATDSITASSLEQRVDSPQPVGHSLCPSGSNTSNRLRSRCRRRTMHAPLTY